MCCLRIMEILLYTLIMIVQRQQVYCMYSNVFNSCIFDYDGRKSNIFKESNVILNCSCKTDSSECDLYEWKYPDDLVANRNESKNCVCYARKNIASYTTKVLKFFIPDSSRVTVKITTLNCTPELFLNNNCTLPQTDTDMYLLFQVGFVSNSVSEQQECGINKNLAPIDQTYFILIIIMGPSNEGSGNTEGPSNEGSGNTEVINNPPTLYPDGGDDAEVDVIEGSNITLNCIRDSGNTDGDFYQWTLPNGQVTPSSPSDISPVQVTLNNINRAESGVYICVGNRTALPDATVQSNVTLNVQYYSNILSLTPGNSTVIIGSTITLNCIYEGNPDLSDVTWVHNSTLVNPSSSPNEQAVHMYKYFELQVNFINLSVGGEYSCYVESTIDNTSRSTCSSMYIIVQAAPNPVHNLKNSSTDTSITLTWEFGFNGNAEISGVIITYARNIISESQYLMMNSTGLETLITLSNLQPQTEYKITVRVRNSVSDEVGLSSPVSIIVATRPSEDSNTVKTSVKPVVYLAPVSIIILTLLVVLIGLSFFLVHKQFTKGNPPKNNTPELSNDYCETEEFFSGNATYAMVMEKRNPLQTRKEVSPPTIPNDINVDGSEKLQTRDASLENATYASVMKHRKPEEKMDEVPPPIIPYDFSLNESERLEMQDITEKKMSDEFTARIVNETSTKDSPGPVGDVTYADLGEIRKKTCKTQAFSVNRVVYATIKTDNLPPLPTCRLSQMQKDHLYAELSELSIGASNQEKGIAIPH